LEVFAQDIDGGMIVIVVRNGVIVGIISTTLILAFPFFWQMLPSLSALIFPSSF